MFSIDTPLSLPAPSRAAAPEEGSAPRFADEVRDAFASLWRRRAWIAGSVAASLVLAVAVAALREPTYPVTARLMLDPRGLQVVNGDVTPRGQIDTPLFVETQLRLLGSDEVLSRVVRRERLDLDPEFASGGPGPLAQLKSALGLGDGRPRDPSLEALRSLQRAVKAQRSDGSLIVDVTVTSRTAVKGVQIVEALIEEYLAAERSSRDRSSDRASLSLQSRLQQLRDRVREAEDKVERFKAANRIVTATGRVVGEQEVLDLSNQVASARTRANETKARAEQIERLLKSGGSLETAPEAVQSANVGSLRSQLAELKRQEAYLTRVFGPRHPDIANVRAQIESAERSIRDELQRTARAARADAERATAALEGLTRSLDGLKQGALSTSRLQVELRELEREAQASRAVYEQFLGRSREIAEQQSIDTNNSRIVSPPLPPTKPAGPSNTVLVAVIGLLGTCLGFALALWRDRASGELRSPLQLAKYIQLPVFALPRPKGSSRFMKAGALEEQDRGAVQVLSGLIAGLDRRRAGASRSILLVAVEPGDPECALSRALARNATRFVDDVLVIERRHVPDLEAKRPEAGDAEIKRALCPRYEAGGYFSIAVDPTEIESLSAWRTLVPAEEKGARKSCLTVVSLDRSAGGRTLRQAAERVDGIAVLVPQGWTTRGALDELALLLGPEREKVFAAVVAG